MTIRTVGLFLIVSAATIFLICFWVILVHGCRIVRKTNHYVKRYQNFHNRQNFCDQDFFWVWEIAFLRQCKEHLKKFFAIHELRVWFLCDQLFLFVWCTSLFCSLINSNWSKAPLTEVPNLYSKTSHQRNLLAACNTKLGVKWYQCW